MGGTVCTPYRDRTALVKLNVYDYTGRRSVATVNDWLQNFGSGAYHLGVVVHGVEWSFRKTEDGGTGIFRREPGECTEHLYRDDERLGRTELSKYQVEALIRELEADWPGSSYSLLHRNSGHFCDEFCGRLGVNPVPEWATRLAAKGARVDDKVQKVTESVNAAANVVSTKANEVTESVRAVVNDVDERLQLRSTAATVAAKASELDEHLGLRNTANTQIQGLKLKAEELNNKLGISDVATNAAARAQGFAARAVDNAQILAVQATDKAQGLAAQATDKAQGLAAQASESTQKTISMGKGARGASESDQYQFGDLTRGLLQGARAGMLTNTIPEGTAK